MYKIDIMSLLVLLIKLKIIHKITYRMIKDNLI